MDQRINSRVLNNHLFIGNLTDATLDTSLQYCDGQSSIRTLRGREEMEVGHLTSASPFTTRILGNVLFVKNGVKTDITVLLTLGTGTKINCLLRDGEEKKFVEVTV